MQKMGSLMDQLWVIRFNFHFECNWNVMVWLGVTSLNSWVKKTIKELASQHFYFSLTLQSSPQSLVYSRKWNLNFNSLWALKISSTKIKKWISLHFALHTFNFETLNFKLRMSKVSNEEKHLWLAFVKKRMTITNRKTFFQHTTPSIAQDIDMMTPFLFKK